MFLLTASGRDLKLGFHGGCQRDKAKAEPALRLHFGESEEIVVGVFHRVSFQRATSDYNILYSQPRHVLLEKSCTRGVVGALFPTSGN